MTPLMETYRAHERAFWSASGAMPTERFLELAKPRLKVRVQEAGSGPPVLFVHGAMTAGTGYAPLIGRLPGFRCVALDRPGCGLSDGWTLNAEFRGQAVEVLSSVLDALELPSVILAGNSLGGLWSTWFALAQPQRVQWLALLGPSIGFPGVRPPGFMRVGSLPGLGAVMKKLMRPSPDSVRRVFRDMGHRKSLEAGKIPDALFDWGAAMMAATPTLPNDFEAVRRAVGFFGARPWTRLSEAELRGLTVKTLVLTGTDDTHGGPSVARRIHELIPGAELRVLEGAGHVPWVDNADAVAEAMNALCAEVRKPVARTA